MVIIGICVDNFLAMRIQHLGIVVCWILNEKHLYSKHRHTHTHREVLYNFKIIHLAFI